MSTLAVLKIHNQNNLHTLTLAAGSAKVGDRIFTLGTPLDANLAWKNLLEKSGNRVILTL
ncbi:MAG: hypothetical protein V7K47_06130 [Nostoc sp.]